MPHRPQSIGDPAFVSRLSPLITQNSFASGKNKRLIDQTNGVRPRRYRHSPRRSAVCSASMESTQTALLLVDHGSKRTAANDMLQKVADQLRRRTTYPVFTAHMEIATPTISDAMQLAKEQGAAHVIVVPFFLSPGRHATTDIPAMAAAAAAEHDMPSHQVCQPLGTHPLLVDALLDRAGLL